MRADLCRWRTTSSEKRMPYSLLLVAGTLKSTCSTSLRRHEPTVVAADRMCASYCDAAAADDDADDCRMTIMSFNSCCCC